MDFNQTMQCLREACKRGVLDPNPFERQYGTLSNLTEEQAAEILKSVPSEALASIKTDLGIEQKNVGLELPGEQKTLGQLDPDGPASARQKAILKEAVKRGWLSPDTFAGDHEKWQNLTAGEADKLINSIPKQRLGALEEFIDRQAKERTPSSSHNMGHVVENVFRTLGSVMDQGM